MSRMRTLKAIALKERQYRLTTRVVKRLRELGYRDIQRATDFDMYGVLLCYHNLTVNGVRVMVRARGYRMVYEEQRLVDHEDHLIQYGAADFNALCTALDAHAARSSLDTVQHWATVGTDDD